MRILFWGTPEFAVPPLRALLGEGHDIVGVVTQPDRPRGRSRSHVDPSPVKRVALEEQLPVLQPEKPRGEEFEAAVRALVPDVSVVVAYGRILPQRVIELPPHGTLNIHGSLLPLLRGAAPIQAAILAGFGETGITIMRMVPALDAGDMLLTLPTPIDAKTTYGELHDRLSELGALGIVQALALLEVGALSAERQDDAEATYAPKIEREMARLDFTRPAVEVDRVVRAFDPRPGAFARFGDVDVKCFGASLAVALDEELSPGEAEASAGTVLTIDDDGARVRCGSGAVRIRVWQVAGRTRMSAQVAERGRVLRRGDRLD